MATVTPPPKTQSPSPETSGEPRRAPVMRVTRYDVVTSFMIALILGLIVACAWLIAVWFTNKLPEPKGPVELEIVELAGGEEDGSPDETLFVESPEDPVEDPAVEETMENVVELSDQLAEMKPPTEPVTGSQTGSAQGTGRSPLGSGGGPGRLGREQRWYVRFSDGTLDLYARQLDFFGIELGALIPPKIVYISNLSAATPMKREVTSGSGENRMYMTWRGGNRKGGDIKLFQKAGVNVGDGVVFHFYPKQTEQMLADLERRYANRSPNEIRRTYFSVQGSGSQFQFVVTRQSYF
jgi:hypothetical protein